MISFRIVLPFVGGRFLKLAQSIFLGIFAAIFVLAVVVYEDVAQEAAFHQQNKNHVLDKLNIVRARLESELNARLALVHGLAAFAKSQRKFTEHDFNVFAKDLSEEFPNIRSLQLAPKAIVTYVYPKKGNLSVVGLNLLADPKSREDVMRIISEHRFHVSGPTELKQGGMALIGRHPIYQSVQVDGQPEELFWGFSTVLIDLEPLLTTAGLLNVASDLKFALRVKENKDGFGKVFFGAQDLLANDPVLIDVSFPSGGWQMAAVPKGGWVQSRPDRMYFWAVGLCLALIAGVFAYVLAKQTYQLKKQIKVTETTAEALHQAKLEAEKANLSKSAFLASMSHELRTPLNAVLGFAQLMQGTPKSTLTEDQNEHINCIISGGEHLLELVNEILDLAKIEANKMSLVIEDVNANTVIAECVEMSKSLGAAKGVCVLNNFSHHAPAVLKTDRQRLKQVVLNLLSNAVKYNKEGGCVTIEAKETTDGFLFVSVTDTGVGIAKEDFENIFEMFHRLGADAMIAQEGTGIGLTVTKHLVECMAGQVGFDSELGVGSCFWFKLPLISNDEVLIWTNDLRIGVDAIDNDHQVLFTLLNKVTHCSVSDHEIDQLIESIVNFTAYHFQREEKIMEDSAHPDLHSHRLVHKDLLLQVHDLVGDWQAGRSPLELRRLKSFFHKLLSGQVTVEDAGIGDYSSGNDRQINKSLEKIRLVS